MQNNTVHINSEFPPAILVTVTLLRGPSNGWAPPTKILGDQAPGPQDRRPCSASRMNEWMNELLSEWTNDWMNLYSALKSLYKCMLNLPRLAQN